MSKLVPQRTIDAIRNNVDVALDIVGIDCTLWIPTNTSFDEADKLDVWSVPTDYIYVSYTAKVFVEWSPNVNQLRKLGLYTEGKIPILVRFGNTAIALTGSQAGQSVAVDVLIHSYFRVLPEFIPSNYMGIEDFEIVNVATGGIHDSVLVKMYSASPRRIKK